MAFGNKLFVAALLLTSGVHAQQTSSKEQKCRLWVAPSSTSSENEPKLGLFAGVDFAENETIGDPEVGIPLVDFTDYWNRETQFDNSVMEFLEGFLWTAEYAGAKWEGNFTTTMIIPGVGILANYHSGTYNLDWVQQSVILRETMPEFEAGKEHPARGAISTFYNLTMRATQNIRAGMELFANFGDVWDGNATEDVFQEKLTRWDYMDADRVLDKILAFMKKYESKMTREKKDQVLDFILGKVLAASAGSHAKVIRSLIPAHPGKLQTVKDMGGTFNYRNPDLVKTQKWLAKHGICADYLESKTSTIPNAGRGAFARRRFTRDDIIAPMPLMQIANDRVLDMFDIIQEGDEYMNDRRKYRGKQIVMNYCFGHPESTALFVPVSPVVSQINHAPASTANAAVRWSKHKDWGNAFDILERSVQELPDYAHLGLVMEVVALKDIQKGEEIFIDYGLLWEEAWDKYMATFNSTKAGKGWPLKALDLRKEFKNQPYRTMEQLQTNPYPDGVGTVCFIMAGEMPDGEQKTSEDGTEIGPWEGPFFDEIAGITMHGCSILSRQGPLDEHFYNYTVMASNDKGSMIVVDVPHYAVTFVDQPYTSDIHTPGAFRHWIGIPDAIFPQAWRDRRK